MKIRTLCVYTGMAISILAAGAAHAADPVKIGFIVKQPEDPWFQDEWRFAAQAAHDKGFELVKIGAPSGSQVLTAIDNLAAQQVQGFVICVPDVKLGPAVVNQAKLDKLKLLSVDDRFVDGTGQTMKNVPYVGISAYKIGQQMGQAIAAEIKHRGWKMQDVGALDVTFNQLPTAKDRTDGAEAALKAAGFPSVNILISPQAKSDTEAAFNAANITLTKAPHFKHWIAFGMNDLATLGAIRASEGRGIGAKDMIGVGINGSEDALNEFTKPQATGFYGTIMLSARKHGYDTSIAMYDWITNNKAPAVETFTSGTLVTRANAKLLQN